MEEGRLAVEGLPSSDAAESQVLGFCVAAVLAEEGLAASPAGQQVEA